MIDKLNGPVELGVLTLDVVVFAYHKGYCHYSDEGDKKHDEPLCVFVNFECIKNVVELGAAFAVVVAFLNVTVHSEE